ncbi:hypothetical protein PPACK8108_LOCUS5417 [Phakopsora pachyrhizi]|uniref:Uncharacterized protein n=1 Tax=Phakopsora pachyrhizi TaxID=170000 RepID=A0AAV0ANV9_PHAPC|nr:hypothetical protein PPACK8108_LOCUS5417 [Phakopsora pachyrhizi]
MEITFMKRFCQAGNLRNLLRQPGLPTSIAPYLQQLQSFYNLAPFIPKFNQQKNEEALNQLLPALMQNFKNQKLKVTKLNWEQQKWHLEKEQKDKEEKEIQFAKDGKDKELEVKMLIADKDREAMKLKEDNAMLLAVVGSSRSIEEIAEISKIIFNR